MGFWAHRRGKYGYKHKFYTSISINLLAEHYYGYAYRQVTTTMKNGCNPVKLPYLYSISRLLIVFLPNIISIR